MIRKSVSVLLAALMIFSLIPVGVLQASAAKTDSKAAVGDPSDIPALALNTANKATLSVEFAAFSFTPDETREYVFYSTGELDTVASLRDGQDNCIVENDDGGTDRNFRLTASLTADQTYYLNARLYSGDPGEVDLYVEAVPYAESLSIDKGDSWSGYVGSEVELNAVFSPEDSARETVEWTTSDSTVAAVSAENERATVSLLKAGSATVTVTSSRGLTDQITFTVLEAETLTVNQTANVDITEPQASALFKFIPTETATYTFFSLGDCDTYGYLLNSDMETIDSNDDGGENSQFKITRELIEGTTYYLRARCYGSGTGSFTVTVQKNTPATGIGFAEGTEIEGYPGYEIVLHARFLPDGAIEQELKWEISDDSVASFSESSYSNTLRCFLLNKFGTTTVTVSTESGLTASITVTVKDFETLSAGETKTSVINNADERYTYKITPSKSGYYAFWSEGSADTKASLCNSQMEELTYNDDSGDSSNFRITWELEAGETYYLHTRFYGIDTGSFPVSMAEITRVTGLEILTPPTLTTYYEGAVNDYFDLNGLSLRISWSDGDEMLWNSTDEYTVRGERIDVELNNTTVTVSCGGCSDQFEIEIIENPVESIAFTGGAIVLIENAIGDWKTDIDGERYFHYNLFEIEPPEVTVYYKDGTTAVTYLGAELNGFIVSCPDSQYSEHYTLGDNNQITVTYLGHRATATVTVLAGSVASIEVIDGYDELLIENYSGFWTTQRNPQTGENEEFFYYYLYNLSEIKIRINYLDGTSIEANCGDEIDGYPIENRTNQYQQPWTVGGENPLVISYMGRETVINVNIEPNPVESLVLLTPSQNTLIENTDGYMSQRYDDASDSYVDFFCYSLYRLNDAVVQINFKNGESITAHPGDYINGYYVNAESNQDSAPFTVGDNPYYISYLGARAAAVATVAESPVQKIEVLGDYRVSLYENVDGYWTDQYYQSQGGAVRLFIYTIPSLRDMDVRVTYKNGTTEIVHTGAEVNGYIVETRHDQNATPWVIGGNNSFRVCYMGAEAEVPVDILPNPVSSISVIKNAETALIENGDGYYDTYGGRQYFIYEPGDLSDAEILISYADGKSATAHIGDKIDGYRVSYTSDQRNTPWTVGSDNFVTVSFMGRDAHMPITVVPTPLESLTIDQAPLRQYVYGDEYYGGSDYFSPDDFAGLRFTVKFKDGTTKTYNQDDIEDGRMIDGHIFFIQHERTQTVGEMPVTFNYMGKSAVYNVKVKESGISNIEIIRLPSKPVYSRYYSPDFRGMRIKITYADGTSKNVTMSESNIIYGFNGHVGFYTGFVYRDATGMILSKYLNGERVFYVSYAGLECEITGLTYREDMTVTAVDIEDFSLSAENMLVTATKSDGSTESIRLTDIKDNRIGWVPEAYYVRALTPNGMLEFYISNPEYAEYMNYDVRVFDISVKFDSSQATKYIRCDVNGDGEVTIDDATRLQSYLAEFPATNITLLKKCGDANADGKIDVRDVTAIQRYLADMENPTRVGEEIEE